MCCVTHSISIYPPQAIADPCHLITLYMQYDIYEPHTSGKIFYFHI